MSEHYVRIVGGPRDGEEVLCVGPEMYEPMESSPHYYSPSTDEMWPIPVIKTCRYRLYRSTDFGDCDGWRYVADEYADGLGCLGE